MSVCLTVSCNHLVFWMAEWLRFIFVDLWLEGGGHTVSVHRSKETDCAPRDCRASAIAAARGTSGPKSQALTVLERGEFLSTRWNYAWYPNRERGHNLMFYTNSGLVLLHEVPWFPSLKRRSRLTWENPELPVITLSSQPFPWEVCDWASTKSDLGLFRLRIQREQAFELSSGQAWCC